MCVDINDMIAAEDLAEKLLGNRLKREQLNFMFEQLNIIYVSPGKDRLFEKDKKKRKMIKVSIPMLIILKSLERMHAIYTKKLDEQINPEPFKRCTLRVT